MKAMKFKVQDQYPKEWVHSNLQEAPLRDCKIENERGLSGGWWEWWTIEVARIEDLIAFAKWKVKNEEQYHHGCNIFINVKDMRIVFTAQDEPD